MKNRGLTSPVSEALAIIILLGVMGILSALLYGDIVPSAETTATIEESDRVLDRIARRVGDTPHTMGQVRAKIILSIPETIQGDRYRIYGENRSVVLSHPSLAIDRQRSLPHFVTSSTGSWHGNGPLVIHIAGNRDGIAIEINATE
ncbi:DUF7266 family protein [Halocatena halophila]|uniref:DUF7266 family protein n=1 Tax=Halocatena halophila TaxID=2814576 RepID=UPI002ED594F4